MDTKLTLKLDREAIVKAKRYARERHVSLSKMVEHFFAFISEDDTGENVVHSPLVRELTGIISPDKVDTVRELYTDHLMKKYR